MSGARRDLGQPDVGRAEKFEGTIAESLLEVFAGVSVSWDDYTEHVAGAFAAAGSQWLVDPTGVIPMIGASGAVSAPIVVHPPMEPGPPSTWTPSARTTSALTSR